MSGSPAGSEKGLKEAFVAFPSVYGFQSNIPESSRDETRRFSSTPCARGPSFADVVAQESHLTLQLQIPYYISGRVHLSLQAGDSAEQKYEDTDYEEGKPVHAGR